MQDARDIIERLALTPHPEGGHYRETYRHDGGDGGRGAMSAIYYLLRAGERSAWHRVRDGDEIWHWYAGAPLMLRISPGGHSVTEHVLGPLIAENQTPQLVVPANQWQAAESLGAWTLVGCTVGPAFLFDSFEMAPPGWRPALRSGTGPGRRRTPLTA